MTDKRKRWRERSTAGHDNSSKSDCFSYPTESQTQGAFCYVGSHADKVILERNTAGLFRVVSATLCALGMTILICLVLTIPQAPILLLLGLPTLQQLATSVARRWIRRAYPPHLWIRNYSPFTPFATSLSSSVEAEENHRPLSQ